MFIFAHVFLGALIGLGFWHLTNDRRALPVCILGTILPDLLDKSLALLFPAIYGSGRTLGHTLIFFAIIVSIGILLWYFWRTLLGLAFACAVISHQVFDALWTVPATWLYPFIGPFPVLLIPDYVGYYFWLEISSPSEWVFALASGIIIGMWFQTWDPRVTLPTPRKKILQFIAVFLLAMMGVYLLVFGLAAIPSAFFAPTYNPITNVLAGLTSLGGAIVLLIRPVSDQFS
jgi:membrane-bound metal-dependent hydrolase YbcI (DUF457 family)